MRRDTEQSRCHETPAHETSGRCKTALLLSASLHVKDVTIVGIKGDKY